MADVEDRLSPRRDGESIEDWVQRGIAESSGGRRYVVDKESDDRRYSANKSYKGTKYASDKSYKGTKYSADKSLEGTKYRADVDERGNRMSAGNTFLKTYADLNSQPSNYFQSQNFLHNGVGAGYGTFVDEATRTVFPKGSFKPYVGAFPGNAAQAMFQQGGDDRMGEVRPPDDGPQEYGLRREMRSEVFVEPTTGTYWQEVVEPTTGQRFTIRVNRDGNQLREDGSRFDQGGSRDRKARMRLYVDGLNHDFGQYGRDDIASSALSAWQKESGRKRPNLDDEVDRRNFNRYVEDWRGVNVPQRRPAAPQASTGGPSFNDPRTGRFGIPGSFVDGPYQQGGDDRMGEVRLTDDRSSLPRYAEPIDPTPVLEPTTGTYWSESVEPTTGQRFFLRVDRDGNQLREDGSRFDQGGGSANWMTDDSWATPEDKQRLAQMDSQFRPGVHKWKAGYWDGLDDTSKDLWRSYWGYRGLTPKSVEHDIAATRVGNADYWGQGRLA